MRNDNHKNVLLEHEPSRACLEHTSHGPCRRSFLTRQYNVQVFARCAAKTNTRIYIYTPTVSYLNVSKRQTRFERRTRKRNNTRWGNARPFSIRNSGKIVVARPRRDEHTPTEFGRSAVSASKLAGNDGRRARMDYRISFADSTARHTGHARRKSARYARFAFVYAYIKSRAPA